MASRADLRDLTASCIRFARLLREHGVRAGPEQEARWLRALDLLGCRRPEELYWSGRITLICNAAHLPLYDDLFRKFWLILDHPALHPQDAREGRHLPRTAPERAPATQADPGGDGESLGRPHREGAGQGTGTPGVNAWLARLHPPDRAGGGEPAGPEEPQLPPGRGLYSAAEVLQGKDFAAYSRADEQALIALLQRAGPWWAPRLRSRRTAPGPTGHRLDLRRTLAAGARSGGDPVRLLWRRRRYRWRKWVFLCDISASMAPYTEAFLLFLHAVAGRRQSTEVFLFGTRLTRITPQLRRSRTGQMEAYLQSVRDWHGGTRLGAALRQFNRQYGRRGLAHGALIVVISDGLDQGKADEVGVEMARLQRIAHRVAWVNPLKRSARYEPTARAMAAALPYLDDFVSGHNLASLVGLLARQNTQG